MILLFSEEIINTKGIDSDFKNDRDMHVYMM